MMYETIANPFWAYKNEPFRLIRFIHKGQRYLIGLDPAESSGVDLMRKQQGYLKPSEKLVLLKILESEHN